MNTKQKSEEIARLTKLYLNKTEGFKIIEEMLGRLSHESAYDAARRLVKDRDDLVDALDEICNYHEKLLLAHGKPFEWGLLPIQEARNLIERITRTPTP